MKIGIVVAMKEESSALTDNLNLITKISHPVYTLKQYKYKNLELFSIISKIGKAAAASATTLLFESFAVEGVINLGSCGGVNDVALADIILSNQTGYFDVSVETFGYNPGQLPQQKAFFQGNETIFKIDSLKQSLPRLSYLKTGFVATGDCFVADINKVNQIKTLYPNIKAIEMEAASIAQICDNYNKDFLLIKKVSDLADSKASVSFKDEISQMSNRTAEVLLNILATLST